MSASPVASEAMRALLRDEVKITVRQVGRWKWSADLTRGVMIVERRPTAFTRERCVRKARRLERTLQRRDAWARAAVQVTP